jgi:uncharacterized RDD family membrane protein YckC
MRQGFAIRLLSMLLDTVIILALLGLISALTTGDPFILVKLASDDEAQIERATEALGDIMAIVFIVLVALTFLLFFFSEILFAASPGKLVLGLRIADENAQPATWRQLILRWLVKNSGGLVGLIGDIAGARAIMAAGNAAGLAIVFGCFFVLGSSRQSLHDKIANTAVFKKSTLRASQSTGFEPVLPPSATTSAFSSSEA